jgi:hypothetical protein
MRVTFSVRLPREQSRNNNSGTPAQGILSIWKASPTVLEIYFWDRVSPRNKVLGGDGARETLPRTKKFPGEALFQG